ncbi:hypothetical protein [Streptomyces caniscabiei]|uniref:hypothetical protein n=1 Tax=Streptomyces caniscabiei TaxID=2746961 RepID=UPI000765A88D|nr:hypothetical protein [Streptomyces caniscabiei]
MRESRELERLDRSASELSTAGQDEVERLRVRHEAVWRSRIETLLEDLDGVEPRPGGGGAQQTHRPGPPMARPPADAGPAEVSGNTCNGPAAFQIGGEQHVHFTSGSQPP